MFEAYIQQTFGFIIIKDKDPAYQKGRQRSHPVAVNEVGKSEDNGIAQHQQILLGNKFFVTVEEINAINDFLWNNRGYWV